MQYFGDRIINNPLCEFYIHSDDSGIDYTNIPNIILMVISGNNIFYYKKVWVLKFVMIYNDHIRNDMYVSLQVYYFMMFKNHYNLTCKIKIGIKNNKKVVI